MRAKQYLYPNNSRIYGEDLVSVKCIYPPPVAKVAVRSKAVVPLLLIRC